MFHHACLLQNRKGRLEYCQGNNNFTFKYDFKLLVIEIRVVVVNDKKRARCSASDQPSGS